MLMPRSRGARGALWLLATPLVYYSRFNHLSRSSATAQPVSDSGSRDVQELAKVDIIYSGVLRLATIDADVELRRERLTG